MIKVKNELKITSMQKLVMSFDSCNTDVNTPLNVHVYTDYVISFLMYTYVVRI